MSKEATKKTTTAEEKMQKELIKVFERFCKELLSEKIKRGISLKKTVLLSKKRTYNKRNIIK